MEEIPNALSSAIYDRYNPDNGVTILGYCHRRGHDFEPRRTTAVGVHVYLMWVELAANALLCGQVAPLEGSLVPHHVYAQSVDELGIYGLWYFYSWSENLGRP
jgi:hypothetical protein